VRLIGILGYRDERLCKRLLDLARSGDDAICDVALHVLAVLGVPPSQHPDLVELWCQRARAAWNHDLIGAAKQLGSPEVLGPVFDCWLIPENLHNADAGRSFLPQLAMNVAAAVADRFSEDAELQFSVWDRLQRLEPTAGGLFFQRVLGSTQVARLCDTPAVVRHYLSALAGDARTRDLAYLRLEECDRPRQLLGWADDPDGEVTQAVLRDALAPTGMVGSFVTQDLRRKLHALHTLLCLSRAEALAVVEAAVAGEQNGHVVASVLDIAACFRLASVPRRVCDLIAGEFGGMADDSERISSHVSAIAVARACEPRSAFEALLHFNLIREGWGVDQPARRTHRNSGSTHPGRGCRRSRPSLAGGRAWGAGTSAGRSCGCAGQARPTQPLATVANWAPRGNAGRPDAGSLRPAAPCWKAWGIYPGSNSRLSSCNYSGAQWKRRLPPPVTTGRRAVPIFDPWPSPHWPGLACWRRTPMPLQSISDSGWKGIRGGMTALPSFPGASLVVGILYTREPAAYAAAAADLLRVGDWTAVVQLASFLRTGPRPAPEPIVNAILDRMCGAAPETGEPDLVLLLGELAPVRIASRSWPGMFSWPPQVRAALAQALTMSEPSDEVDRRVNILLVLMGDGQYGVRREAFRALARISPEGIRSFCTAWAIMTEANLQPSEEPYGIDMRRTAAEAAAWLDSPPTEGPIADLAWDPEPEVRATFERCRRERRERDWAEHYLRHVLDVQDDASLIKAWKYGRALERLGDDYVLERLEQRRRQDLPPSVRHWLGRLIQKVRSRWDEVTRGWPEPWVARRGRWNGWMVASGRTRRRSESGSG
jgi:hypothetical protein